MEKKVIEALASGSVMGALGVLIAALMSKRPIKERFRNMAGGILAVLAATWILRDNTWQPAIKEAFIGCTGAFIGIYWPEIEALIKWVFVILKWVLRKVVGKKLGIEIPDISNTENHDNV